MSEYYSYTYLGPEHLQGVRTMPEALRQYDALAGGAVAQHESTLDSVAGTHLRAFDQELRRPGSQNIDGVLDWTSTNLQTTAERTGEYVQGVIGAASEVIEGMLSQGDRQVLNDVRSDISYSVSPDMAHRSRQLRAKMNRASNPAAVKAALDNDILQKLRTTVMYETGSQNDRREMQWLLSEASTPKIRKAMLASLDSEIFGKLRSEAWYGVSPYSRGSRQLSALLDRFSSTKVKTAMACFLDADILSKLRSERSYGVGGSSSQRVVEELLSRTSSTKVREVFKTIEPERQTADFGSSYMGYGYEGPMFGDEAGGKGFSMRDFMSGVFARMRGQRKSRTERGRSGTGRANEQQSGDAGDTFDYEAFIRNSYSRARQQSTGSRSGTGTHRDEPPRKEQRQQQTPPPRTESRTTSGVGVDAQAEQVVRDAILRDRQRNWLRSENPADVRRVINTVQTLRQKNPGITDRQIYLKFRKAVEKGTEAGKSSADPGLQKSFSIVDALMGGHNGKLSF